MKTGRIAFQKLLFLTTLVIIGTGLYSCGVKPESKSFDPGAGYKLVWADEFEGSEVDETKWNFDWGDNGWGNNELEYYTGRTNNAFVDKGVLTIRALKERFKSGVYTSARLKTRDLHSWTYGVFAARIKLPVGKGIWPAFWMLGAVVTNFAVGWPECGEIDIMEIKGQQPDILYGTAHGPKYYGNSPIHSSYRLPSGTFADDYHVFSVEWTDKSLAWSLDGRQYYKVKREDVEVYGRWVFDAPFFILLNTAIGGNFAGSPDESTVLPQEMKVDWVRVYQR